MKIRTEAELIGQRFERLTIVREAPRNRHNQRCMTCRCTCGADTVVLLASLVAGTSRSCGCLQRESASGRSPTNKRHGLTGSLTHRIWCAMRARCQNPKHDAYAYYGGRGIAVCERWQSFDLFLEDMGECPPGHSIERSNNDRGYEPGNCSWVLANDQWRNRRSTKTITHNGRTLSHQEWARVLGISAATITHRLKAGWPVDRVLTPRAKSEPTGAAA